MRKKADAPEGRGPNISFLHFQADPHGGSNRNHLSQSSLRISRTLARSLITPKETGSKRPISFTSWHVSGGHLRPLIIRTASPHVITPEEKYRFVLFSIQNQSLVCLSSHTFPFLFVIWSHPCRNVREFSLLSHPVGFVGHIKTARVTDRLQLTIKFDRAPGGRGGCAARRVARAAEPPSEMPATFGGGVAVPLDRMPKPDLPIEAQILPLASSWRRPGPLP